jgi:hypothetical protein
MNTIAIATSCRHCGREVEDAMHIMLCDRCLDTRLGQLERAFARAAGVAAFAVSPRRAPVASATAAAGS